MMLRRIGIFAVMALLAVVFAGFALTSLPSCSWAQDAGIPASDESVNSGFFSSSRDSMLSSTSASVSGTGGAWLTHNSGASGIGRVSAHMIVQSMSSNGRVERTVGQLGQDHQWSIPDLVTRLNYRKTVSASGVIDRFNVSLHYESPLPDYQSPEPWFMLR